MPISVLAAQYEHEWIVELKSRGITPNGATPEERRQQAVLARFKPVSRKRPTPSQALAAAAAAYRRSQGRRR